MRTNSVYDMVGGEIMETTEKTIFTQFINIMWKNLGKIIFMSLIWGLIVIPCIFLLPMAISMIVLWIIALPVLTGIIYECTIILKHESFSYKNIVTGTKSIVTGTKNIVTGTKKYYLRSICFYGVILLFTFVVGASYWQYFKMRSTLYLILSIIQSFFYLVLLISQIYTLPIIVNKDIKFGEAFKESFIIFQSNSSKSIKMFFEILIMCIVMAVAIITIPMFLGGALAMFISTAYYLIENNEV